MYDTASMEAKKMIVNCLIKRVEVYRDYKLHIDFNIDFEQFSICLLYTSWRSRRISIICSACRTSAKIRNRSDKQR